MFFVAMLLCDADSLHWAEYEYCAGGFAQGSAAARQFAAGALTETGKNASCHPTYIPLCCW